jgi:hypothetical protein
MSLDSQDRDLTRKMRAILAFAKEQMPESIICIFSFTQAEDNSPISMNKVCTNSSDRENLAAGITTVLEAMRVAEVTDLTDVQGGMQ